MKKTICILLVLFQLLSMTACSDGTAAESAETDSAEGSSVQEIETEAETEPEETEFMPDLPAKDFEGDNFVFLTRTMSGDWLAANIMDIFAEEENGEGLNDAVFQRNMYMADTYNIVIEEIKSDDCNSAIRTSVAAQDKAFDVSYVAVDTAIANAGVGNFLNYYNLEYIDFSQPWWDSNAAESLEIAGKLYVAVNDIMLANNNATSAVLFNKQMIEDYGFTENPYDLVRDYEWSIDKITEMSTSVSNDTDGNGVYDENDTYGFMAYRDASLSLFHSSGGRIAAKDAEGNLTITLMQETTYDALIAALTLMAEKSTFNLHKVLEASHPNDLYSVSENMFRSNQGLFYWILIHDIQKFRDMEADFGVLPVPSSNPQMYGYGCNVNQYHGCLMSVLTTADPVQAGYVLEAMSAKSRYTVQEEYYNICLDRKYSRDEDSSEMLDIIFDNRVYDVGAYYTLGNFSWDIIYMTMTDNTDIASIYRKSEKVANKQLEKLIKNYSELD